MKCQALAPRSPQNSSQTSSMHFVGCWFLAGPTASCFSPAGAVPGGEPRRVWSGPDARSSGKGRVRWFPLWLSSARVIHELLAPQSPLLEGFILHNIARHDDTDPRPTFDLVVRAALA